MTRGTESLGSQTVSGLAELLPVPACTAASQHPAKVLELQGVQCFQSLKLGAGEASTAEQPAPSLSPQSCAPGPFRHHCMLERAAGTGSWMLRPHDILRSLCC